MLFKRTGLKVEYGNLTWNGEPYICLLGLRDYYNIPSVGGGERYSYTLMLFSGPTTGAYKIGFKDGEVLLKDGIGYKATGTYDMLYSDIKNFAEACGKEWFYFRVDLTPMCKTPKAEYEKPALPPGEYTVMAEELFNLEREDALSKGLFASMAKAGDLDEFKGRYSNSGEAWDRKEVKKLINEFSFFLKWASRKHQRTELAILYSLDQNHVIDFFIKGR